MLTQRLLSDNTHETFIEVRALTMQTIPQLAAPEVVILTASRATSSDEASIPTALTSVLSIHSPVELVPKLIDKHIMHDDNTDKMFAELPIYL